MRKICLIVMAAILCIGVKAQYKKASFFTRNGKFYGAAAGVHVYGHGVNATPTIAFIYGKDQNKKHVWHWWDLEVSTPSNYSYTTHEAGVGSGSIAVSGKIRSTLTWRYNWCFYFGDNTNADIKSLPFVKIAVEAVLAGGGMKNETSTPDNLVPSKYTYAGSGNGGADIGVGYKYRISEKSTVFGVAGYRWILNDSEGESFYPNPSHPYLTIGIRFSPKNDD